MNELQRFCLDNIYCSPAQDLGFDFKLVRVHPKKYRVKNIIELYNAKLRLPDNTNYYNVYTIGQLNPQLLNLLRQGRDWFRDTWVNLESDMNERNYIARLYTKEGLIYPRAWTYYSFIDQNALIIAQKVDSLAQSLFPVDDFIYFNCYSNWYFHTQSFTQNQTPYGIQCFSSLVMNNLDKVRLQNELNTYLQAHGDYFCYVNGYYYQAFNLEIPNGSFVELLYDQSVLSREKYPISDLRTFNSIKDNKLKYFIYRDKVEEGIEYWDDTELYLTDNRFPRDKGVYYYTHLEDSQRNVTDKDYSVPTQYVFNLAQPLLDGTNAIKDLALVLYKRYDSFDRKLIYSQLKLHELYKLPSSIQYDVISNTNYTIDFYRAEYLENSSYFKIADLNKINDITLDLAVDTLGYNGISYYFAYNYKTFTSNSVENSYLYRKRSLAYEYDENGKLLGYYKNDGDYYNKENSNAKYVEFIKGEVKEDFGRYYAPNEIIYLEDNEYRLYNATFINNTQITQWVDITNDQTKYQLNNNQLTLTTEVNTLTTIRYLKDIHLLNLELDLAKGLLYFPITIIENRFGEVKEYLATIAYRHLDIYLNGYRLIEGIDFFYKFPYVNIVNKTYLDYTKATQSVHVRMRLPTINEKDINEMNTRGFVNNGVLGRNHYYDIRDDKLISVFIDGKFYPREHVRWAEEDNTVRLTHPLNGKPYLVTEPIVPIYELAQRDTLSLYLADEEKNKKISELFNLIYPEPKIDEFNAIADHHYLFSSTISKMINDIITGVLPQSLYINPYDDSTIINLLDNDYKNYYILDPIYYNLPDNLVEIHPHLGNSVITLNLFQYRFIMNVIRIITKGNINRINLSGYLAVGT